MIAYNRKNMKDFLEYVAEDMLCKYGTNMSQVTVVFPNKRASLFLNEHLARLAGKPLWSPAYITISELFRRQTTLQVADPIKQVCDLHKAFCRQTGSAETLDKFYGWGQMLLADFDDIDKNMADADRVFANLRDIHELDDVSYLTDEQREMIRRFFSNFSEDHNTELKERFLRLWSHFADVYHDFNELLAAQGLAYEGALYRQVALHTDAASLDGIYLFVGFNLLQKVEQQFFATLQKAGKARFYWDFDHYYTTGLNTSQAAKGRQHHEAGQYISRYLSLFPNELDSLSDDLYGNFSRPKHISVISASTENIQAHYVSTWLRASAADGDGCSDGDSRASDSAPRCQCGRRTAIVMCNENLLPTIIHCLPDEVDKVNITTGYPLSQTPVASFVQLWFNILQRGRTPQLQRSLLHHPYTQYAEEVAHCDTDTADSLTVLLRLLRQIARNGKEAHADDPLFQETLFCAYTLVNRLESLRQSGDLLVDLVTLQRLVGQLMQQTSIPFHGEPAEGIQVMGVLETRNIDFDHVLLLSCNEGNLPRGVNDSSFIPHSIRRAYELTTVDNKVSIYAYYFHRLLQRASDITILYNNSTEDGQRGEMSRFILQLMVESGHTITQHTLQTGQAAERWKPQPVEKTPRVIQVMGDTFQRLSPTAICTYIRCPLQFYYRYVADIMEPDTPDDEQELDNRIFGNIFHEAADIVYHQLPRSMTRDILDHLLKEKVQIERAVDEAFHHALPHSQFGGLHLINREVIIHYLRQLVTIDRSLAPFTILGLEYDVEQPLPPLGPAVLPRSIGGRIDRLDLMQDGTIRVVDYKTGGRRLKPLPDVEAIFLPENIHEHSAYYLQTFVYADIVSRQQSSGMTANHLQSAAIPTGSQPHRVAPALFFIQHAGGEGYDPTLCFGQTPVSDIATYSARFNELLHQKIAEIFSPDMPFTPTSDTAICRSCRYKLFCRR